MIYYRKIAEIALQAFAIRGSKFRTVIYDEMKYNFTTMRMLQKI